MTQQEINYQAKYLKYKERYKNLKLSQKGGASQFGQPPIPQTQPQTKPETKKMSVEIIKPLIFSVLHLCYNDISKLIKIIPKYFPNLNSNLIDILNIIEVDGTSFENIRGNLLRYLFEVITNVNSCKNLVCRHLNPIIAKITKAMEFIPINLIYSGLNLYRKTADFVITRIRNLFSGDNILKTLNLYVKMLFGVLYQNLLNLPSNFPELSLIIVVNKLCKNIYHTSLLLLEILLDQEEIATLINVIVLKKMDLGLETIGFRLNDKSALTNKLNKPDYQSINKKLTTLLGQIIQKAIGIQISGIFYQGKLKKFIETLQTGGGDQGLSASANIPLVNQSIQQSYQALIDSLINKRYQVKTNEEFLSSGLSYIFDKLLKMDYWIDIDTYLTYDNTQIILYYQKDNKSGLTIIGKSLKLLILSSYHIDNNCQTHLKFTYDYDPKPDQLTNYGILLSQEDITKLNKCFLDLKLAEYDSFTSQKQWWGLQYYDRRITEIQSNINILFNNLKVTLLTLDPNQQLNLNNFNRGLEILKGQNYKQWTDWVSDFNMIIDPSNVIDDTSNGIIKSGIDLMTIGNLKVGLLNRFTLDNYIEVFSIIPVPDPKQAAEFTIAIIENIFVNIELLMQLKTLYRQYYSRNINYRNAKKQLRAFTKRMGIIQVDTNLLVNPLFVNLYNLLGNSTWGKINLHELAILTPKEIDNKEQQLQQEVERQEQLEKRQQALAEFASNFRAQNKKALIEKTIRLKCDGDTVEQWEKDPDCNPEDGFKTQIGRITRERKGRTGTSTQHEILYNDGRTETRQLAKPGGPGDKFMLENRDKFGNINLPGQQPIYNPLTDSSSSSSGSDSDSDSDSDGHVRRELLS